MQCASRHVGRLFGLAAFLAFAAAEARAQETQLITDEQERKFAAMAHSFKNRQLKGDEPATKEQLDLASRYYILRVTKVSTAINDPQKMATIVKDFMADIDFAVKADNKGSRDTLAKLSPLLVQRFKEVFDLDFAANRIAAVNAATMLPTLARLKQEEIADFLTALIADPKKHDAIRVHALKGLRDYFPARAFTRLDLNQPNEKANRERKDRELKRVETLLKVMDRPMPTAKNAPPTQEELDGFRFVRKEAVVTLAETQVPALSTLTKVEGPVALGLVKVLARKLDPEPTLKERLEATYGICNLKARDVDGYEPGIGIYLVGKFLVDFVTEYKKDYNNLRQPSKSRQPTYFAWKIEAKRLEGALVDLEKNTKSPAAAQLLGPARPILQAIYAYEGIEREQDLRGVVERLRPKSKTLFKDGKGAAAIDFDFEPPVEAP